MLYRIDYEHFITHFIDHFSKDDILHFQYAVISAGIKTAARVRNVTKLNEFYPNADAQIIWRDIRDKKILKKMYTDYLSDDEVKPLIYNTFINPILNHVDIMIICMDAENVYIDILVNYLKEKFSIECIDLNKLFIEGSIGSITIDMDKIHNKIVDIRREAGKKMIQSAERTSNGREKLLSIMRKSEKIKKLKELGINVTKNDKKDLDALLQTEWVED